MMKADGKEKKDESDPLMLLLLAAEQLQHQQGPVEDQSKSKATGSTKSISAGGRMTKYSGSSMSGTAGVYEETEVLKEIEEGVMIDLEAVEPGRIREVQAAPPRVGFRLDEPMDNHHDVRQYVYFVRVQGVVYRVEGIVNVRYLLQRSWRAKTWWAIGLGEQVNGYYRSVWSDGASVRGVRHIWLPDRYQPDEEELRRLKRQRRKRNESTRRTLSKQA